MEFQYNIKVGKLYFQFNSCIPLLLSDELSRFSCNRKISDVIVNIRPLDDHFHYPINKIGEDMILDYYEENGMRFAIDKPGLNGSVCITEYDDQLNVFNFHINFKSFPNIIKTVDKVMQLLPLREVFVQKQALILHSSQIVYQNKGIVFTAPSGTGKTTHAKLWEKYLSAQMVCNDRTLIQVGHRLDTYGFPVDGSSPICSNERYELGTIVILRQSPTNHIERLSGAKALKYLFEQTVMDSWNANEMVMIRELWIDVINRIPIYLLKCDISNHAVLTLKQQLEKDGVVECKV